MTKLRLYQVVISGFKALNRLEMGVSDRFTLLIGANGAGKSSILQGLGFFRYIVEGRGKSFFEERAWNPQDLRFRSSPRSRSSVVSVSAIFMVGEAKIRWDIQWGLNSSSLFSESVRRRLTLNANIETLLKFSAKEGGQIAEGPTLPAITLTGSVIPAIEPLMDGLINAPLIASLAAWAGGIRSMELLSPNAMKGGTRLSPNDMGIKGDRLAGFLASLNTDQKSRVVQRLGRLYPISELSTVRKRAGWIDMHIAERYQGLAGIPSSQMSDGFMRLLALCAVPELEDDVSLVLLDELEDGIEPHILSRVADLVIEESRAQIIATSHSPILVNHVGVDNVRFISRDSQGVTRSTPTAEMPAFSVGSEYFGAGEMWTSSLPADLQTQAVGAVKRMVTQEQSDFK